jgi:HSP90 family molecular chaperone
MKAPELNTNQMVTIGYFIGILIVLYIVYKILNAVGLLKTPADKRDDALKAAAVTSLRLDSYFDPDYYTTVSVYNGMTVDDATKAAKDLRDAMAGIGTDEEKIYTIFGDLPSKTALSEVSNRYKAQYGFPFYIMSDDLKTDLLNELNATEVTTLMSIIDGLPDV